MQKYAILHVERSKYLSYQNNEYDPEVYLFDSKEEAKFFLDLNEVKALVIVDTAKYNKSLLCNINGLTISNVTDLCCHTIVCNGEFLQNNDDSLCLTKQYKGSEVTTKKEVFNEIKKLIKEGIIKLTPCYSGSYQETCYLTDNDPDEDSSECCSEEASGCCDCIPIEQLEIVPYKVTTRKLVVPTMKEKNKLAELIEKLNKAKNKENYEEVDEIADEMLVFLK